MRFLFAAFSLAASSFALVPAGTAQADDPYTVTGVPIDATASNALEAQTVAMREGQVDAARLLIERLTLAEDRMGTDFELEPHMTEEGEMVEGFALDRAIISELISGLEIRDEQRSATRYLADIDVSFDRRSVARVLTAYGVPFVESQSRRTLVLPVLGTGNGFLLWEENPWGNAWREQNFRNSLTPMFVPEDAEARAIVSARSALGLDEESLRQLAVMYDVNRIAILRAQERDGIRRFGGYLVSIEATGEFVVETWGPATVYGGWRDAAADFVADRETAWKQQSVVRDFETTEMRVTVLYSGLPEWRSLQAALTRASLVDSAQLDALSRDGARMTVNYRGALEQLVSELAERGATLEEHPGLGWVVLSAR